MVETETDRRIFAGDFIEKVRIMRILAMTDIHGAYDLAREIIRSEPSDVVIIGGDLTTVGSIREAEEAWTVLQRSVHASSALRGIWISPRTTNFS